jgi:hypothetical protein
MKINLTMAKAFIACGAIAAGLSGAGTAILLVSSRAGDQLINYAIPALFIALAYGIYRKSRASALIAFLSFVGLRFQFYRVAMTVRHAQGGENAMTGFWTSAIAFSLLYLLGVIGTFAWHAAHAENESAPASPAT